ncbi:MAG: hypothetical protein H8Z69_03000 [Nanohaloarchaea archaeon]|nr:hypothetical protein [Candidatus Nanohaloarchaea archaeon]
MVILGSALMGSLNSIKVNSLDPSAENTSQTIEEFGRDKSVRIGWDEEEEEKTTQTIARKQFEGLLVWNMLAASDCMLLQVIDTGNTKSTLNDLRKDGDPAYTGFGGFGPLLRTGFEGRCAEADSVGYQIKRTAYSMAKVPQFNAERVGSPAHDMEGNFGRVGFNVSESFHIDTKGDNGILLGFHGKYESPDLVNQIQSIYSDVQGKDNLPDFWIAQRASIIIPPNLAPSGSRTSVFKLYHREGENSESLINFDGVFNGFGYTDNPKGHKLYAWRPSAHEVPWVFENQRGLHSIDVNNGETMLDTALRRGEWHFCEGAEGQIISKARSFSNTGEASGNNPKKEDSVFPKITLFDPGEGDGCEPGGPEGFPERVTTSSSYQDTISCSRQEAANKKIPEGSRTLLGYDGQEKMFVGYGCGLQEHNFDFGSHDFNRNNHYDGEVTFYTPAVYSSCSYNHKWYNVLPLKDGIAPEDEKTLKAGEAVNFDLNEHNEIKKLQITFEKRDGADLDVSMGEKKISINSSNNKAGVAEDSTSIEGGYDTGVYELTYRRESAVGIPGGEDASSGKLILRAESGEANRKVFLSTGVYDINSVEVNADSGQVSLRDVSLYSYPTQC